MDQKSFTQSPSIKTTLKLALVFVLVLILMIPQVMILDLVRERQNLNTSVKNEVAESWGKDQTISGPALVIPYKTLIKDENGKKLSSQNNNFILLPEKMSVIGDLTTQSKSRSLYDVLLYNTLLSVEGEFTLPDVNALGLHDVEWFFNDAFVITGISDMKGINSKIELLWNGAKSNFRPGMNGISFRNDLPDIVDDVNYEFVEGRNVKSLNGGLQASVKIDPSNGKYTFKYNLNINGSQALHFLPLAKENTVTLESSFPDPNFTGAFLPIHSTNSEGFKATWQVYEYNRSIPPYYTTSEIIEAGQSSFGLKIDYIIDHYSKSNRSVKYMFLIVALTFLVVFLTEIVRKKPIHIFQYILIGLALAIFFVLLLSVSEFIGFDKSFLMASLATILLIYLYSIGMFNHKKSSLLLLALLVLLFGYIYTIIQLEKTALLIGSIGLFVIIAATMYATRKIDWYEGQKE